MNKDASSIDQQAFDAVLSLLEHIRRREDLHSPDGEFSFHFASANAMFAADRRIWEQLGLKPNDALLLSRLSEIARYADQSRYSRHPRLDTFQPALNYLVSNFYGMQLERFYMLCLDKRGCLKEKVLLYEGTVDCTLLNLPKLLREAVRISPHAVVLSHNHPGGTMHPSEDDISSTESAMRTLSAIGIPVLDHLIIAGNKGISLRLSGYIPESQWISQQPGNRLLVCWPNIIED